MIGVQILYHLVMEMSLAESMRSLSKHRRVASSFRDESLYDIFTLSCTLLRQINVHDDTQVCVCVCVHNILQSNMRLPHMCAILIKSLLHLKGGLTGGGGEG